MCFDWNKKISLVSLSYFISCNRAAVCFTNHLCHKESSLSGAHLLGLAAFVVHLHASSVSHGALVQLVPSLLSEPVTIGEVLSLALVCSTRTSMIFCVRWGYKLLDLLKMTRWRMMNLAWLPCWFSFLAGVQVVCGSCVLWDVQRGITATARKAELHPQQLLQEGSTNHDFWK